MDVIINCSNYALAVWNDNWLAAAISDLFLADCNMRALEGELSRNPTKELT